MVACLYQHLFTAYSENNLNQSKLPTISVDKSLDRLGVDGAKALLSYARFKLCEIQPVLCK